MTQISPDAALRETDALVLYLRQRCGLLATALDASQALVERQSDELERLQAEVITLQTTIANSTKEQD